MNIEILRLCDVPKVMQYAASNILGWINFISLTLTDGSDIRKTHITVICFCIPVVLLYSNRNNENLFSV